MIFIITIIHGVGMDACVLNLINIDSVTEIKYNMKRNYFKRLEKMMGYVDKLIEELELQVKKTSEEAIKTIEKTLRNRNKAVNEFIILAHKKNKQLKEDMEHASEYSRIEILAERQDLIDGIEEATKIITEKPEIE